MKNGSSKASVTLEGLNLRDNKLTTRALATLAPVIDLAQNDIKTIVLSNNAITVSTDEQAQQWETFLTAFKNCKTLRRLDLSSNPDLGVRALEILSKVHAKEPAIHPIALSGNRSVYTLDEAQETDDNDNEAIDPMTSAIFLSRRCGLRSIPYISIQDIGINDTGALWLSYILEDHYFPNQLISEINAAPANSSVDAYQQDADDGGIDWRGNKGTLGKDGLSLLTKTETIRKLNLQGDHISPPAGSPEAGSTNSLLSRGLSRATVGNRRSSIRSIHTDDGGEHELSEVESMRKRIQRHIIESRGIASVELWKAAIETITTSRKIASIAAPTASRTVPMVQTLFTTEDALVKSQAGRKQRLDSGAGIHATDTEDDAISPSTFGRNTGKSYAATLALSPRSGSEDAITEVTNTPETPKLVFRPHRKEAFSEGSDTQCLIPRRANVSAPNADRSPERFIKRQKEIQASQSSPYRDETTACQLPLIVFDRILEYASPAKHVVSVANKEPTSAENDKSALQKSAPLLSDGQRQKAFEWGQRKETIAKERKWAGMAMSAQQLMLLDAVGCLAYER